ncbi:MAG: hypothetical protein C1943_04770 [Halochromatium sp.]|nr:hypothetical protein [Halochromatium sp.]
MSFKYQALAMTAALAFSASGLVMASESETEILVSGDEPMNVDNAAEVSDPTPNAEEQAATQEQMDKVEATDGAISGKDD